MVEKGCVAIYFACLILIRHIIGLIYRHYRPVHYSPSSRSALAEAELVYKEDHVSHSVYVTFDLDLSSKPQLAHSFGDKLQLLVWTTTPWTLTANMVSHSLSSFIDLTRLRVSRYMQIWHILLLSA